MSATATMTALETGTWTIDPAHSYVGFKVRHLMAAKVRGSFTSFAGTIEVGEAPGDTRVDATIQAASIDTGVEERDNHLRSADFFDVEEFPTLTFESTAVRETDGGFEVEGDLTIKDVTRPVTLDVEFGGVIEDPWGTEKAIFSAETRIDREEWGLTWNTALETGGVLVGKKVQLELEVQASMES